MALLVATMGFAQNKSSANLKSKTDCRTIVPPKSTVQNSIRALRSNEAIIILSAGDVWGDGSGYQMLLDADATAYGSTIPTTGNLSTSGDVPSSVYDQFEYKIPTNADGACNTTNIVLNNSVAINVPAGTYDWCITNPTPDDLVYIASSNGNIAARYDNYVFEAGKIYTFTVSFGGTNDQVDLTIEDMPTGPTLRASETQMSFYNDISSTNEASTVTIIGMNLTANITATVTAPFSVSSDNNTFGTTATLGTIGGTLYVNYSPATTGTDNGTLTLTSDGAAPLTIALNGTAYECNTIYAPWIETFDPSNPSLYCWSIIDNNQDGNTFGLSNYSGNYCMVINYTDQNNDFLLSPSLYVASGDYLTFKVAHRGSYPETYQVYAYVNETLTSIRNATQTTTVMPELETVTVDLSAYEGQTIQIAIRNTSADQWTFYVDDFILHNTPTVPEIALTSVVPANGSSIAAGQGLTIGGVVTNNGINLTSYKVAYTVDGGEPVEYTVSGINVENMSTHSFTHPTAINGLSVGSHTIAVTVSNPNGVADNNSDNNQTFTINVVDCSLPISTFPYVEDFENGINPCWTLVDADGDGYGWVTASNVGGVYFPNGQNIVGSGHNSSNMFVSGSFTNATNSVLNPDNWAISPAIDLTNATTAQLSFFAAAQDREYPAEHYGVYVSTTTTDPSAFILIWDETMDQNGGSHSKAQGTWGAKTANLSDYVGQTIYIGFRHFNCSDAFLLLIDDVKVNVTFTINVVSNNDAFGTATGGGTFDAGAQISISATPTEHYHFVSWNDGNTDNPRTVTVSDAETYTAIFAIDQFNITVNSNDETMGTTGGSGTYNYGDEIQISATPAEHHHFVQWSDGNVQNPRTITVTDNASYTAEFAIDQHSVMVASANNAWGNVSGSGTYNYGEVIQISATPAEHYHFVSWNDGNTDNPRTITVTEDLVYVATFAIDQFEITVNSNSETMGTVNGGGTYDYGDEIQISATPAEHYHFVSWNDGNADNPRTITVTESASYTATFAIDQFTITLVSDDENMGTVSGDGTYDYGSERQISAIPVEHFRFVSWNDNNTDNPRSIILTADTTFTAYFEAIPQYVIEATSSNEEFGTVAGGGTYYEGTTITINATPNDGYVFTSWDDGNTENPRTIIVTENASYVANFVDILTTQTFTITATSSNEAYGTVTGGGTYAGWTIIELVATANDGYRFVAWDDDNTENPRQITVLEDATYTAIFEAIPTYDITVNITGNGTVTYNGEVVEDAETITVREGENVALSMVANANNIIASVIVDETNNVTESLVNGVYTFENVMASHSIDITFIPTYNITVNIAGNGSVTYNGEAVENAEVITVTEGENVALTIVANDNNRIANVIVDGTNNVTESLVDGVYTFENVTANHNIGITFVPTYDITVNIAGNGSVTYNGEAVENAEVITLTEGENASFTIVAATDNRLVSVIVDGTNNVTESLVDGVYTFENIMANHSLDVTFEGIPTYDIIVNIIGNGSVTNNGEAVENAEVITLTEGETASFTIVAATDNRLVSVIVDGTDNVTESLVDGVYTFENIMANHSLDVTFEGIPTYDIIVNIIGSGSVSHNGDELENAETVTVFEGETPAFVITPDEGYKIDALTIDETTIELTEEETAGYTYSFDAVAGNHILAVKFVEIIRYYTITIESEGPGQVFYNGEEVHTINDYPTTITVEEGTTPSLEIVGACTTNGEQFIIGAVAVDGEEVELPSEEMLINFTYTFEPVMANHTLAITFVFVSSADMIENGSMAVYPNPNSGMFSIDFSNIEGDATYQLIDVRGAIVETRNINVTDGATMNFNHDLKAGTYFVRIINGDKVYVKQIVVE